VEQAFEKVKYYVQRWKIERFHYVLKSGCAIEKLQERDISNFTFTKFTIKERHGTENITVQLSR
jgi:hypothetical protein